VNETSGESIFPYPSAARRQIRKKKSAILSLIV